MQVPVTENLREGWRAAAQTAAGSPDIRPNDWTAVDAAAQHVLEALALPTEFTLEVKKLRAGDDPPISYFHATFSSPGQGVWTEAFGSKEQLQAFLKAVQMVLRMLGYGAVLFGWDFPDQWQEPSGRRWHIPRGGLGEGLGEIEDLNSGGEAIRV